MSILPMATNLASATPRMRQAAQQFEGQVLGLLLQPIFASASNPRGGSAAVWPRRSGSP